MVKSKKFKMNKEDGLKILKGAGIAVAGALLTYGAEVIPGIDLGSSTPLVAAVLMILINAGRKWVVNNK